MKTGTTTIRWTGFQVLVSADALHARLDGYKMADRDVVHATHYDTRCVRARVVSVDLGVAKAFGFDRVCKRCRWAFDPAIRKLLS